MSENNFSDGFATAVSIKKLCKSYENGNHDKELVLNNFSMRVKKGSIYGFLGASGCGKTTVLSCIVGLTKWDSGQVLVFGKGPGSKESGIPGKVLGYMPQDLALYNQLSIMETVKFYGTLYNMPNSAIMKQWKVLSELLNLSESGSQLIGKLSGGQKRRASLVVAMIHSPQLLVLDEPTVGLDPVLRENIWNYLYQSASKLGTTIIITTHYIEEARYADMIGLLRRGRMVVEESPTDLMIRYESDLLEQVVMKICRFDEVEISSRSVHDPTEIGSFREFPFVDTEQDYRRENQNLSTASSKLSYSNFFQFIHKTLAYTWVIFICFYRYLPLFITIVMIPAIQGTVTLWVVGSKPIGLPLGIINHEVDNWMTACDSTHNHTFVESELISACELTSGMELKMLSCQYLNQVKKDDLVDLISFNTEEEARVQVDLGKSWGFMVIPENFSQSFGDLLLAKQYAMNESIEGSRIPIRLDFSQFVSRSFIIRNLYTSYSNFLKELANSCSFDEKVVDIPLNFRNPIYGDNEDNYTQFAMPGLLLCSIFVVVCSISGLLLISDHRQGTLSRATVAGLSCSNVISSHLIVQGVIIIAQLAIWNLVLYFIFSIPFNGQVWLYILICFLSGLSGTALGIFLGIALSTEAVCLCLCAYISTVLLLYGGIVWPTEAMTKFWQTAGNILPTNLPIQSLRSVIVRGVGIEHASVWPGILISVLWTVGLVVLSVMLYRKKA